MREIVASSGTERKFARFLAKHPDLRVRVTEVIEALRANSLDRSYDAHKLSGKLRAYWGADVTPQAYRVVYHFDRDALYLVNIGTHDETYR